MAMPSGNFVISDKIQFPNGAGAAGVGGVGEIHHPRPWFPDERDGFISWLRAEFAAANAIIDSLCHHLRAVGEPGEYDLVIGCVHQRRGAWNPVLHMQQYFPISEIMLALQQVAWRRQQRIVDQGRVGGKEFKRPGLHSFGSRQGQRAEATKESHNLGVDSQYLNVNASIPGYLEKKGAVKEREGAKLGHDVRKFDDKGLSDTLTVTDASLKSQMDNSLKTSRNTEGANHPCAESPSEDVKDEKRSNSEVGSGNLLVGKNGDVIQNQNNENRIVSPKTFSPMETIDGKMVNVAEGLNLYDKLLDEAEVSKLISLVNDLRATGKRGQFPGSTFMVSKRPYRGHGREMIQLGVAMPDVPFDESPTKDRRVEPIPGLLRGLIDRLMSMQLTPLKPDSCIIDIFHEGDHSQPHSLPPWYGRPICSMSLNDCDMVFGTAIAGDRPGVYRGALRITVSAGSLLVMQGNSVDIAKRAIPSIRKERILVTFLKSSQSRKAFQGDSQLHSQAAQASNWSSLPSRPSNHIRPKHYAPIPTTGVLPSPPIRAQLPPPNGMPSLFVPPVPSPMGFQTSVPLPLGSAGWPAARHPPPRLPVPGTGVFLPPPGSAGPSPPVVLAAPAEVMQTQETTTQEHTENNDVKANGNACGSQEQECNRSVDEGGYEGAVTEEDLQQSVVDSKTAGTTA